MPDTKWINFRKSVSALSEEDILKFSPATGTIDTCLLHFPEGCNSLVEIQLFCRKEQILPTNRSSIALNNATNHYDLNHPLREHDPITLKVINHDSSYPHTVTALVAINVQRRVFLETHEGVIGAQEAVIG